MDGCFSCSSGGGERKHDSGPACLPSQVSLPPPPLPGGAQRPLIVFSDALLAAAFPTATATGTQAIRDGLWPGLAGLRGVSAVTPGTSWQRVPTRNAAAVA